MIQTKILAIRKEIIITIIKFALLLGLAVSAPFLHYQAVTGSIVNAVLFIAVAVLGVRGALLLCLIPSVISLAIGLLPPILAPMIPFIIFGNAILVVTFNFLRKKNYWLGVISAAVLKFIFLALVSYIFVNLFFQGNVASEIAAMFVWPQLLTALAGGVIAYIFLKSIKNNI